MVSTNHGASSTTAIRRLLKELGQWRSRPQSSASSSRMANVDNDDDEYVGIERFGPVNEDDLFAWEAVINGRGIGGGYDDGRWLLRISVPPNYPLAPPTVRFVTGVVHPNVSLTTGEVCLDLLRAGGAWTAAWTLAASVRAIRLLLAAGAPGVAGPGDPALDSPLNVDVAALLRNGDDIAARALIELWCCEEHYDGP